MEQTQPLGNDIRKQKRREYEKAYREANKEKIREKSKAYREANKESVYRKERCPICCAMLQAKNIKAHRQYLLTCRLLDYLLKTNPHHEVIERVRNKNINNELINIYTITNPYKQLLPGDYMPDLKKSNCPTIHKHETTTNKT